MPNQPPAPPSNVIPFPRKQAPDKLEFEIISVSYTPNKNQQRVDLMVRSILVKAIFDSSEIALAKQLPAREQAKAEIMAYLGPFLRNEAERDAAEGMAKPHYTNPYSSNFFHDFSFSLKHEYFNVCSTDGEAQKNLLRILRTIKQDLLTPFGHAIKAGTSTQPIKDNKDKWQEHFKTLDFPAQYKGFVFLLLDALVEHYILNFWAKIEEMLPPAAT